MNFICPKRQPPLRSQLKKDLYRLLIARSDVDASLQGCKLLLETVKEFGDDLYYPLYSSIVVCYARPFTKNEPFGALPKKWNQFEEQRLQDTHNKLIQARNELIAHSDMNVRKAMISPPGCTIGFYEGRELKSDRIGCQVGLYFFPIPFFKEVYDTAIDLGKRLNDEIDQMTKKLYSGMKLPTRAFQIRIDEGL